MCSTEYSTDKLCNQKSERQEEVDLARSPLKHNGYPDILLYRNKPVKKTKNSEHETRGLSILPYLQDLLTKSNDA